MVGRTERLLFDEVETYKDNVTGEVISTSRKQLVKREKSPEFIQLFTQGLSILTKSDLTKGQAKVLYELLKYTMNNSNMLMINRDVKDTIALDTELTKRTVDECLRILVSKDIIIRKSKTYFLNPLLFGRGQWTDIKRLTQNLEISYDFENNTATENIKTRALYKEADKVSKLPFKVVEDEKTFDENGESCHKISVEEDENLLSNSIKNDEEITNVEVVTNENKADKGYELELLREQNKQKELSIRELELKIKAKELGL